MLGTILLQHYKHSLISFLKNYLFSSERQILKIERSSSTGSQQESWIRTSAARTRASAHMGYQYYEMEDEPVEPPVSFLTPSLIS